MSSRKETAQMLIVVLLSLAFLNKCIVVIVV